MPRQLWRMSLEEAGTGDFRKMWALHVIHVSFPTLGLNSHLKATTPLFLQHDPFLSVRPWRNLKKDKQPVGISLGMWNGRNFTFCFTSSYYFNSFTNCFCT